MAKVTKKVTKHPDVASFPQKIYVQWEQGDANDYLIASETPDDIEEDGTVVGVYELREVKVLHVDRHLEDA